MIWRRYLIAVFAFQVFLTAACSAESEGEAVTICQLVQNLKYDKVRVHIQANYKFDGIERSSLTDPSCPTIRIRLKIDPRAEQSKQVQEFRRQLYSRIGPSSLRTMGESINLDFVGIYSRDRAGGSVTMEQLNYYRIVPARH